MWFIGHARKNCHQTIIFSYSQNKLGSSFLILSNDWNWIKKNLYMRLRDASYFWNKFGRCFKQKSVSFLCSYLDYGLENVTFIKLKAFVEMPNRILILTQLNCQSKLATNSKLFDKAENIIPCRLHGKSFPTTQNMLRKSFERPYYSGGNKVAKWRRILGHWSTLMLFVAQSSWKKKARTEMFICWASVHISVTQIKKAQL